MGLRNKRILITAGPTWVPIDSVRIISNIATGQTGILLAEGVKKRKAKVTLLLGPCGNNYLNQSINVQRFNFFDELKSRLIRELRRKKYDIVIHNAAVSDFKPSKIKGKLDSGRDYDLKLKPLPKIIFDIKRLAPKAKLVMFKFEPGLSDKILVERAILARQKAGANLIVANRLNPYRAFIIDKDNNRISVKSRQELVKKLIKQLSVFNYSNS